MTPKEKNLIRAALEVADLNRSGDTPASAEVRWLVRAADQLIYACPTCNRGGHVCPGCGDSVSHVDVACKDCEGQTAILRSPCLQTNSRVPCPAWNPQDNSRCEGCAGTVESAPRLKQWDEDYPGCAAETCGGGRYDPCATVLRTKGARHDDAEPVWTPATFGDLLPGDPVRLGQLEAVVNRVSRGDWHARNREWIDQNGKVRDHQTPWEHEELRIDLTANPGFHVYPPATACEILMNSERLAIHVLQQAFVGTVAVDRPTGEGVE